MQDRKACPRINLIVSTHQDTSSAWKDNLLMVFAIGLFYGFLAYVMPWVQSFPLGKSFVDLVILVGKVILFTFLLLFPVVIFVDLVFDWLRNLKHYTLSAHLIVAGWILLCYVVFVLPLEYLPSCSTEEFLYGYCLALILGLCPSTLKLQEHFENVSPYRSPPKKSGYGSAKKMQPWKTWESKSGALSIGVYGAEELRGRLSDSSSKSEPDQSEEGFEH